MNHNTKGNTGGNSPSGTSQANNAHLLDKYSNTSNPNTDNKESSPYYQSTAPSISLPKGGGALKGIDEKFTVNAVNGTSSLQIPLPLTPGRNGFTPSLSLQYNSGSGNSEFGLGWGIGLPSIQRKTDKKLPEYDDEEESDVFLLAGAEDLVPLLKGGDWAQDEFISGSYLVKRYRPRIEGLFARIEHIKKLGMQGSWWRVTTKDNIATYYGLTPEARIADPANESRIFKWLPQLVCDNKGNVQQYEYIMEDLQQVPQALHERNRNNGSALFINRYLKRVKYCNLEPYSIEDDEIYQPVTFPDDEEGAFLMEAVLDYGDHGLDGDVQDASNFETDYPKAVRNNSQWPCRKDPYSDFHAGFEMRTYRRCRRVLMFHYFTELQDAMEGGNIATRETLVRSLDFVYHHDDTEGLYAETDFITRIIQKGYKRKAVTIESVTKDTYARKALPAMRFDYQQLEWSTKLESVSPDNMVNAPQGLTGPYQWIDLWGEGLPGMLTEQGNGWFYKNNKGDGEFTPAIRVAPKPSVTGLGSLLQWQDLDADGRRQVVSQDATLPGYFELDDDQQWQSFKAFKERLNIDWNSPYTKMLDLDGDGRPDLLMTGDHIWTWFKNLGTEGYTVGGQQHHGHDEEKGPRLVLNDLVQSIFLADMSGDGMTDIVRIKNGEVCYWPNMGYGRFGKKIAMTGSPWFDNPDNFNPAYLTLADLSGTGAADLVYFGNDRCTVWINYAGNAWSEAKLIESLPTAEPYSKIAVLDFLGNGTGCLVWSSPLPQHAYAPMRYIDLMGGNKPYIMSAYHNGMGKTVSLAYKSSTKYYLEDKENGRPWATRLPFPVQCVSTISTSDSVSETTYTQSFEYHHGYYDHEEREFRGFGRVDTMDTDVAVIDTEDELQQAPVLTKTWYHTGAWLRERSLLDAFSKEYYKAPGWWDAPKHITLPSSLSAQETREAYRALKGSPLRQEVYAADNSDKQDLPYAVTSFSYEVKQVQPLEENRHASFQSYQQQKITWHCERDIDDPRILQELTLETDEYGNVLKNASVAYPRQNSGVSVENISDALASIDLNDATSLKETMDDLLGMSKTAEAHYQWLGEKNIITKEINFNEGLLQFPGSGSQYQLGIGDFSVEGWVKCTGSGTFFQYETNCSGWPGGIHVFISEGKVYLFVSDGNSSYRQMGTVAAHIKNGVWAHLAVTRGHPTNTANWRIYVNGVQAETTASGGMTGGNINGCGSQVINFGRRTVYTPDYLIGSIKDIRWYGRVLNAAEVGSLYNDGLGREALDGTIFDLSTDAANGTARDISPYEAGQGVFSDNAEVRYRLTGSNPSVFYTGDSPVISEVQGKMLITVSSADHTTDVITPEDYRLRLPYETRSYELTGMAVTGRFWSPAELLAAFDDATAIGYEEQPTGSDEKRLLSHSRIIYGDLTEDNVWTILPLGYVGALGLEHCRYQLAFTGDVLADGYGDRVTDAMLTEGGYLAENDIEGFGSDVTDKYWLPGGTIDMGVDPYQTFYMPLSFIDPWSNETVISYWDDHFLLPESTADAKGNIATVNAYDWRCLQPSSMTDPNENVSEILYDMLCMPVAMALKGKVSDTDREADELGGLDPDGSTDMANQEAFWDDPMDGWPVTTPASELLGNATWRCIYDLDTAEGQPAAVAMIARSGAHHGTSLANLVRLTYTDGLGRIAMHKMLASPETSGGAYRWIGSGKTVYNNKGKAVMQYEPYYTDTHAYDPATQAANAGVTPIIHYDPLGRAVRTDLPDGTYTKMEWTAWLQVTYDNNDTVLNSQWYADMVTATGDATDVAAKKDAALKASVHHGTPTIVHLDTLARPFYTIQHNKVPGTGLWEDLFYESNVDLDIAGNRLAVHDARGLVPLAYKYCPLNIVISQVGTDSGQQYMLMDTAGNPLYMWDADNRQFRSAFDKLRRPVEKTVRLNGTVTDILLEKTEYGEGLVDDTVLNLRGKLYRQYDGAGRVDMEAYDFKGNPLAVTRTYAADYSVHPHWYGSITLESTSYTTSTVYDALNRPLTVTSPDGTETLYEYNTEGLLWVCNIDNGPTGGAEVIMGCTYDAKGQLLTMGRAGIGNTNYEYDPHTFRVTRIYTPKDDTSNYQDLRYWYDPVGNITTQRDDAQQTTYFSNSVAEPHNDYTYDALYRLIKASGREHAGNNSPADESDSSRIKLPHPNDAAAMRRYTQYYSYDGVGNMTEMKHTVAGGTGSWTRTFEADQYSNRLLQSDIGSSIEFYDYDARGNQIAGMSHILYMDYNAENRMEHVELQDGRRLYYQYDSGGQRVRKVTYTATGNILEVRKYVGNWEVYCKYTNGMLTLERESLSVMADKERVLMIDTCTIGCDSQLMRATLTNHLSTATVELDEIGNIISYEEYYPFGSTSFQSGESVAEVSLKRYRYTSKERDEETGMYYHGARYYIPWLCRWTVPDPITSEWYNSINGQPGRSMKMHFIEICASTYEYCYDNPVRFADPSGEQVPPEIWRRTADELGGFDRRSVEAVNEAMEKGNETIDKSIIMALKAVAYKKNPELLLNDLMGWKMTEERKQEYFKNDFEASVGILLYEFATGTGVQNRNFYYSKDMPNSFANAIVNGYVFKDIIDGIYRRVKEEVIERNVDWNNVKDRNGFYGFPIEFSPDQTGLRLDKSLDRHIESNPAQFFLGGATVKAYPIDDTTAKTTIYNETSRNSMMLHLGAEDYSTGPLRTISQSIHFNVVNLNSNKTVNYQPDLIDKGLNKVKWLQNALD